MAVESEDLSSENLLKLLDPENKLDDWILIRSAYVVPAVLTLYLAIIKIGPKIMERRPPFNLHLIMRLYNFVQVVVNLCFVIRLVTDSKALNALVKTLCSLEELVNVEYSSMKETLLWYGWIYLVLKISDLLDTIFMVLRKKNSHITFLHVYHHSAMVFFVWMCFKYSQTHHGVIPVFINVMVHAVMYTYYFLATFPSLKKQLWWKKYLTKFQLGQFVTVLLYFSALSYFECHIPRVFTYVWMFNVTVFAFLFMNFYIKAYTKKDTSTITKKTT